MQTSGNFVLTLTICLGFMISQSEAAERFGSLSLSQSECLSVYSHTNSVNLERVYEIRNTNNIRNLIKRNSKPNSGPSNQMEIQSEAIFKEVSKQFTTLVRQISESQFRNSSNALESFFKAINESPFLTSKKPHFLNVMSLGKNSIVISDLNNSRLDVNRLQVLTWNNEFKRFVVTYEKTFTSRLPFERSVYKITEGRMAVFDPAEVEIDLVMVNGFNSLSPGKDNVVNLVTIPAWSDAVIYDQKVPTTTYKRKSHKRHMVELAQSDLYQFLGFSPFWKDDFEHFNFDSQNVNFKALFSNRNAIYELFVSIDSAGRIRMEDDVAIINERKL